MSEHEQAQPEIANNVQEQRFELSIDGQLAVLDYRQAPDRIIYTHTGVPKELSGQGIGSRLARYGLEYARENNLAVVPLCPFVRSYIERHPEYESLVYRRGEGSP